MVKAKLDRALDLESLYLNNRPLLVKWWWRIGEENEALWRRIVASNHGEDNWGWVPRRCS